MIFSFDEFELDIGRFELRKAGRVVPIEPLVFSVLRFLTENCDRMVSREELTQNIWGGRVVSDWAISAAIKSARLAIGDTGKTKRHIRTIHGTGFRFVGAVTKTNAPPANAHGVGNGQNSAGTELSYTVAPGTGGPSIAVMPFQNFSGDPEQDYFADGITEDLITDLSAISRLRVISRNASFAMKGDVADLRSVGRRLNVRYIIEGSVRRSSEKIRINAKLTEIESGAQLWAERFDGDRSDIFGLQDRINSRIVSSLSTHLASADALLKRRATSSPQAYDLCLRGRWEYYLYTPEHLARAQKFFEQAVEIDPGYAEAYAYQSYCRTSAYVFAWPGSDSTLGTAVDLAKKAIALDDRSAVAHARLGWVLGFLDRPEEMTASFERALSIDPFCADAYYAYGETMNRRCVPKRALVLLNKAMSIDTFVPPGWEFAKGHSHILLKSYDEALSHILPVLERVPRLIPARVQITRAYVEMDRLGDAQEMVRLIREFAPRYRLQNAERMFPYPDLTERRGLISALKKAGLPE